MAFSSTVGPTVGADHSDSAGEGLDPNDVALGGGGAS